eukprot:s351_g21.t1
MAVLPRLRASMGDVTADLKFPPTCEVRAICRLRQHRGCLGECIRPYEQVEAGKGHVGPVWPVPSREAARALANTGPRRKSAVAMPLWHGAQLAVDATLVSPLTRTACRSPQPMGNRAVALARAVQRKRRHTYPELLRARRCRLVVFGIETGGQWGEEAATFLRLLAQARAASAPVAVRRAAQAAWVSFRWPLRCSSFLLPQSSVLLVTHPLCTSCWLTHAGVLRWPPHFATCKLTSAPARMQWLSMAVLEDAYILAPHELYHRVETHAFQRKSSLEPYQDPRVEHCRSPAGLAPDHHELVQGWWRASSTKLRLEGELQESRSERTLRRNGDEASPAENPGGLVADSSRGTCCTRTGKEANKGGSFLSPAARFESENDKATASASVDLGVCLPSLAPRSIAVGAAHRGPAHRCSWRPARRCARLAPPGSAGDGAFEGQCSGGEHAGCGACSSMVSVRIEHAAAGAAVRAKREGHAQAAQEHDAEV